MMRRAKADLEQVGVDSGPCGAATPVPTADTAIERVDALPQMMQEIGRAHV